MASEMQHPAEQEHGLKPRQYILIGILLTVITVIELVISYSDLGDVTVPILLALSAVKFAIVVGYFMHLRFDAPVFTRVFVGSLALGMAVAITLISLFWADDSILPL